MRFVSHINSTKFFLAQIIILWEVVKIINFIMMKLLENDGLILEGDELNGQRVGFQ